MSGEPTTTILGNLVEDPTPRVSQAGRNWATLRIASTPRERDRQSGEYQDGETLFVSAKMFGDYAENVVASLTKGMRVIAHGRLKQRSYTDSQGAERSTLELEVEAIGPDLRWAQAQVTRARQHAQGGRTSSPSTGGWGDDSQAATADFGGGAFQDAEQPF